MRATSKITILQLDLDFEKRTCSEGGLARLRARAVFSHVFSSRENFMSTVASLFEEATRAVIHRWTALNLAVCNNWGDGDSIAKREALVQQVLGCGYHMCDSEMA